MQVKIDPSVTPEQQRDPRFLKLWRDTEIIFNSRDYLHYKLMLGLHEAGHIVYARLAGGTERNLSAKLEKAMQRPRMPNRRKPPQPDRRPNPVGKE
jgi:hypothetical protein